MESDGNTGAVFNLPERTVGQDKMFVLLDSQLRGGDGVENAEMPPGTDRPTLDSMKQSETHAHADFGTQ